MNKKQLEILRNKLINSNYLPDHVSNSKAEEIFESHSLDRIQFLLWIFSTIDPDLFDLRGVSFDKLDKELFKIAVHMGLIGIPVNDSDECVNPFTLLTGNEQFNFWMRAFILLQINLKAKQVTFSKENKEDLVSLCAIFKDSRTCFSKYLEDDLKTKESESSLNVNILKDDDLPNLESYLEMIGKETKALDQYALLDLENNAINNIPTISSVSPSILPDLLNDIHTLTEMYFTLQPPKFSPEKGEKEVFFLQFNEHMEKLHKRLIELESIDKDLKKLSTHKPTVVNYSKCIPYLKHMVQYVDYISSIKQESHAYHEKTEAKSTEQDV